MTAPLSWNPPAPTTTTTPPPLVVRPDRGKIRSWLSLILVLNGTLSVICVLAGMWAASAVDAWWGGAAFVVTLAGCVFQMVFHSYFYGRMAGAETIATIGPEGIHGPTGRWVFTTLPWSSITSVTNGWNAVVVKPVEGRDLVIPTRAVDTDRPTVRAAVHHFSGGRL